MDPSPTTDDRSDIVCFCMMVDKGRIRAAIASGERTVEDLQFATGACTGCGTCREELLAMLATTALATPAAEPPREPPDKERPPAQGSNSSTDDSRNTS